MIFTANDVKSHDFFNININFSKFNEIMLLAFLLWVKIFDNCFFFNTLSITFKQLPSFYFMLLFLTLKCLRLLRAFSQRRVQ